MNGTILIASLAIFLLSPHLHAQSDKSLAAIPHARWIVTAPSLFTAGPPGAFDETAVKDPTIVRYRGRWHMFYTAKPRVGSNEFKTGMGYVSSKTLEGLRTAARTEMRPILGDFMIAPQVFYFSPQKLWYLIGHVQQTGRLTPVYSTNPDIENVRGWKPVRRLETARRDRKRTWIDFWVICDDAKAHLFYSDHTDVLYRMECPLAEFPEGFARAAEQPAVKLSGTNAVGPWNFHEAAHIYRVKSDGRYLALLEGGYPLPGHDNQMNKRDARNRFMLALLADRLEGPWRRVEAQDGTFFAEASRLFNADGSRSLYTQLSHPELIRSGYDERLEIANYNLTMLFQGFDGSKIPDCYDYQALPWELALMNNFSGRGPSAADYPSIQEAIRANPGRMVYVPAGDYDISEKIQIGKAGGGLFGPGRIRQTNPNQPILVIENANNVQIRDLTLMRPDGKTDTQCEGVLAIQCRNLVLENLQVLDNRTRTAAIALRQCVGSQIRGCLVQNYMRISVDDRTGSPDWGYAFKCIDGTGIAVSYSKGTLIQGNRVIEQNLLPTPEIQKKFDLGRFVKKNPTKGIITNQKTWDSEFAQNWHQGSAIIVTAPEVSDQTQILGNYIENAAQGIDIHADHVIVAQNIIHNSHIGMKAMHGSRHVLILGNQFIKNDLWSIALMPGAASRAGTNTDGGSLIANNIISDFGYGHSHWMWGENVAPLRFNRGQKPDNPPLTDVLIQGNIVYDTGRDRNEPPRYKYAVIIEHGGNGPKELHFSNNLLHPGANGVSNVELQ